MPVPASLASLSTTPGSNSPSERENPFPELDDHIRQGYAFTAQLRDQKLNSSAVSAYMLTVLDDANAGAARTTLGAVGNTGNETIAGVKTFASAPVSSAAAAAANELMRKGEVDSAVSSVSSGLAAKADLAGSASQTFSVAAATDAAHAVRLDQALGHAQTWQDVLGSRSLGTTYTNTTGRPIALSLRTRAVNSSFVNLTVGGLLIARRWGGDTWAPEISIFSIIPPGATYLVTSNTTLDGWFELR